MMATARHTNTGIPDQRPESVVADLRQSCHIPRPSRFGVNSTYKSERRRLLITYGVKYLVRSVARGTMRPIEGVTAPALDRWLFHKPRS